MTDRVNTAMNAVKALASHSPGASPFVDTGRLELCDGDNPVLVRRQSGDYGVRIAIATFRPHVGALSDNAPNLPLHRRFPVLGPALPEREGVPRDPRFEGQREPVAGDRRQVDEPVEALRRDRRLTLPDIRSGELGWDRVAI